MTTNPTPAPTSGTDGINPSTVHYSHEAYQPDVHLRCGRWTTPSWTPRAGLPDSIYQTDEGDLYTFERIDLVTCEVCRRFVENPIFEIGGMKEPWQP